MENLKSKITKNKIRLKKMILPEFQLKILFYNIIATFLGLGFITYQVLSGIDNLRNLGDKIGLVNPHPYYNFVDIIETKLFSSLVIGIFITLIIMIFASLIITNKVAGPIYRLQTHLKKCIVNKKYEPLFFRQGDFFKEIPFDLNQIIQDYESKNPGKE